MVSMKLIPAIRFETIWVLRDLIQLPIMMTKMKPEQIINGYGT